MEQKPNNALEKVEQIAKNNQTSAVEQEFPQTKSEQERLSQKRVERARQVNHLKAERQKLKATKRREKLRVLQEKKQKQALLKEQRAREKELIKNETKSERERRLKLERQLRKDRLIERRMEKSKRLNQKSAGKKKNNGNKGLLTAVISLGIATLVLASALTFTLLMPSENDNMLESTYQKSFYDTVQQVDNIDLNLSKALATKDKGALQKYLVNTAINSELAENDLQQLPLQDQSKFYTTKLINQIGDYAKYLNNKLIDSGELSISDLQGLSSLYRANLELKQSLQETVNSMGTDYNFSSMIGGGDGDLVISNFNQLQNLSVQYPELIYDGPFSDGQTQREIKGLKGEQITKEQAIEQFRKIFAHMNVQNIKSVGEAAGDIECFNVQGEKDGDILFAQISKTGGNLIMFSFAGDCTETRINDDQAIEKAQEFLSGLGLTNLKPVWINLANSVYTINFAGEKDGVILYPDLIKVRVCSQTSLIIGMEAKSYYANHFERQLEQPALSESKAKTFLSENIQVDSVRLALVPIGLKTERLCYEFFGTYDDATYYIYIDAVTGKQVEMFKVVEGTEGQLLI